MPSDEITRTINSDTSNTNQNQSDSSSISSNDYTERVNFPISIPDFSEIRNPSTDEKYVAYNIKLGNKRICSKRYKEFDVFNSLLKRELPDYTFPSFPKKWPFRLTDQQLESRRKTLETYMITICSVRVIYETDLVKDFLQLPDTVNPTPVIETNEKTLKQKAFDNSIKDWY